MWKTAIDFKRKDCFLLLKKTSTAEDGREMTTVG